MECNTTIGNIGEAAFILKATKLNFDVSIPFNKNSPYDVLLDNGKRLLRIQIKTTSQTFTLQRNKRNYNCFKFIPTHGRKSKELYKNNSIDFFAFYIICKNTFYIMPCDAVKTKTIKFYTDKKDHVFNEYKENWLLLNN